MSVPRVLVFEELDSTMLEARRALGEGRVEGATVFVAAVQSGGVGRFGRAWASPRGGLWMTAACPLGEDALRGLGVRLGLACLDSVRSVVPEEMRARVGLKWPNDVRLDGRKVCGVLAELACGKDRRGWSLVGVGLNANFAESELPAEVRGGATTLMEHGVGVDLERAAEEMGARIAAVVAGDGVWAEDLARARVELSAGKEVGLVTDPTGARVEARFAGLEDDGEALFRTPDGRVFRSSASPAPAGA
ncbi:MAG: biotin--[acetyl-CoA-carboxylase] ligase [Phycisphaerales bacterium]